MNTSTPFASADEIEQTIAQLNAIIDRLSDTIEEETAHMRAGRVRHALALGENKTELARSYAIEIARLNTATEILPRAMPDVLDELRRRHQDFRVLLQTNLTVLATAHAVSEGIIRGVSDELARKRTPQTYGPSGLAHAPTRRSSQPLAVSRSL